MTIVNRFDVGPLARPTETDQGFWIVEGIASRAGVFEYARADGSVQRELRLPEDVHSPSALAGYQGAPLTKGHPGVRVDKHNAKRYSVGTVLESARRDGDLVRVKLVVTDADAIDGLKSKKMRALSTGYSVDLEERSGTHPVYGRYDAIQRKLIINHLALCEDGRAGPVAIVRVDEKGRRFAKRPASWSTGWRADAGMMVGNNTMGVQGEYWNPGSSFPPTNEGSNGDTLVTSIEDGHQHIIDPDGYDNDSDEGATSYATSEDSETGHMHSYIRNSDGTYTITMNEGHTHTVLRPDSQSPIAGVPTTDARNTTLRGRAKMKTEAQTKLDEARKAAAAGNKPTQVTPHERKLLNEAAAEIVREKARADAAEAKLAAETARADAAEGSYESTLLKLEEAEARERDDAAGAEKDELIERLTHTIEDLTKQRDDAMDPTRVIIAANERAEVVKVACPILGIERTDNLTNDELRIAVVEKLQGRDIQGKTPEYIKATFDAAVHGRRAGERAIDQIRAVVVPDKRVDQRKPVSAREKYLEKVANGSKRENWTDNKGA